MRLLSLKTLKGITFLLLLILFGSLTMYKITLPAENDLERHVKNGELIMHGHFEVLYSNVYSYTMPEQRFVNHHWLSGVIFYLVQAAIGWGGLVVFKVIVFLAAFTMLFRTATRRANFWLVALFSIPMVFILLDRSTLRPEIFSYLFIAAFLYSLTNMQELKQQKRIFWLVPLQLLWVNMHIFFIAGPVLVGGFLFEKIIQEFKNRKKKTKWKAGDRTPATASAFFNPQIWRLFYLLMALIAVSFLNPNGFAGATYPLHIFNNYGIDVTENESLINYLRLYPAQEVFAQIIFYLSVILLATSFLFNLRKLPLFYFLASVVAIVGSFMIVRMIPLFALIFLPAITLNFNIYFERTKTAFKKITRSNEKWKPMAAGVFSLLLICIIFFKSSGIILNDQGKVMGIGLTAGLGDAEVFFRKHDLKGPIFNDYDIGGSLINFYPREKVFVDNRPEAYSVSFFENTYSPAFANEDTWKNTMEKYQFNIIYLYQYGRVRDFMYRRIADSLWSLVYADRYAVIFLKNSIENREFIKKNQITPYNVSQRVNYLQKSEDFDDRVAAADIFNLTGRSDLGMETFIKVVSKWPKKGKIWKVMGQMELQNNQNPKSPLLAIMYFKTAIGAGYNTAEVYSWLANAYKIIGFNELAEESLHNALRINPEWLDAKYQLEMIEREKKDSK